MRSVEKFACAGLTSHVHGPKMVPWIMKMLIKPIRKIDFSNLKSTDNNYES